MLFLWLLGWFLLRAPQRLALRTGGTVSTGPSLVYAIARRSARRKIVRLYSRGQLMPISGLTPMTVRPRGCTSQSFAPATKESSNLVEHAGYVLVLSASEQVQFMALTQQQA